MKKRLIGILLTVMIIAGIAALFAIPVSAADNYTYTFNWDISGTQFIKDSGVGGKDLTINLKGHTWTLTEEVDTYNLGFRRLRIENGTVTTSGMKGKYGFEIWGGLELENVNFVDCSCKTLFLFSDTEYGENVCTVKDCTFKNGKFTGDGGVFRFNIQSKYLLNSEFYNCNFINCSTTGYGGAIYFQNMAHWSWIDTYHNVSMSGCNFLDCHADKDGGAIYIDDDISFYSYGKGKNYFGECNANGSGGAIYVNSSDCAIYDCIFFACVARTTSYGGGGILLDGSNDNLYNCEFYECEAPYGKGGAMLWCDKSDCTIDNCIFEGQNSGTAFSTNYIISLTNCYFSNRYTVGGEMTGKASYVYRDPSEPYTFSAENYSNGVLVRGDSPENPILIKNYDDLKALALNQMKIDSWSTWGPQPWANKYYRLETDIDGWFFRFYVKEGHLDGNGHRINTRLAKSFICGSEYGTKFESGSEYGIKLIENGVAGYSRASKDLKFVDRNGNTVSLADLNGNFYFLNKNMTWLGDAWYVVYGDVTYNDNVRLEVNGTVNILLLDGSNLNVKKGIHTNSYSTLNIYSEHIDTSDGNNMGSIRIDAPKDNSTRTSSICGIGSNPAGDEDKVVISICGGNINVISRGPSPAIGNSGKDLDERRADKDLPYMIDPNNPEASMEINLINGCVNAETMAGSGIPAIGNGHAYAAMAINMSGGKVIVKNPDDWIAIGVYNRVKFSGYFSGGDLYLSGNKNYLHSEITVTPGCTVHRDEHTVHIWKNGVCEVCYLECQHEWNNAGVCDICQYHCQHSWDGDECTICKVKCSHSWNGKGVCAFCGIQCTHDWNDNGFCNICNVECAHEWNDKGVCTNCKMECTHTWGNNGFCTICNVECAHNWDDKGVCSTCTYHCPHEWNDNGVCTVCFYECHHNGDTCALCGKVIVSEDGIFMATVLSEGSLVIVCSIACLAVGFLASMFIFKKKKPALASGENKDEE